MKKKSYVTKYREKLLEEIKGKKKKKSGRKRQKW